MDIASPSPPPAASAVEDYPARTAGADRNEIRIRHDAIGVNWISIIARALYPLPAYPAVIGAGCAGVPRRSAPEVTTVSPGDRVVYMGAPVGAYA